MAVASETSQKTKSKHMTHHFPQMNTKQEQEYSRRWFQQARVTPQAKTILQLGKYSANTKGRSFSHSVIATQFPKAETPHFTQKYQEPKHRTMSP